MLVLLSPSKDLNFDPVNDLPEPTRPMLKDDTAALAKVMKTKTANDLKKLMKISDNLAELNVDRYQAFQSDGKSNSSKAALFAFTGDVYRAMQPQDFDEKELDFAQNTVRTLSGLYGVLKPLDLIQPYRLEMGTRLETERGKNLYDFWGDKVTETLNQDIKETGASHIINLASAEYYKVVNAKKLDAPVIDIKFLEEKDGKSRVIGLFSKRARGMMTKWIVENKAKKPGDLSDFDAGGYKFQKSQSTDKEFVYSRKQP